MVTGVYNWFKTLLQQDVSELLFYGDLLYKFKINVGKPNSSDQFKQIIKHYKKVGYNIQSACLHVRIQRGDRGLDPLENHKLYNI